MPNAPRSTGDRDRQMSRPTRTRQTSTARGYDAAWRRASAAFIEEQFAMGNVVCELCGRMLSGVRSEMHVDHITPVTGPDDPLFWLTSNWRVLHPACHSRRGPSGHGRRGGR